MSGGERLPAGIQAAVWDLDGTLLDTLSDIADAFNRVLERRGFPTHDTAAYRYFAGAGARQLATRALPEGNRTAALIDACLQDYITEYRCLPNPSARPYDGIPELLSALTRRGVRLAVLSNKVHAATLACVTDLLQSWAFDAVFGQRDGVPRKPDPAGAFEVAARLGLPPDRCLFLGDTAIDMETASAAGMVPVGVLWGFRTARELRDAGARFLLRNPGDLLALFPPHDEIPS